MRKTIASLLLALALAAGAFASAPEGVVGRPIASLDGKRIGVQTAVLYEELIKDRVPGATFQYYTMPNDLILALKSGKIDAYLIEEVSYGVQKKNHPDLAVLSEPAGLISATAIIGNNERQERLLSELNAFIKASWDDGLLDELYDYWVADFDPVGDKCDVSGFTGENGTLSVAVEGGYEPFSFISDGRISGFDVDFIARFCRAWGYVPEFHEVPFEAIAPGVESGKYDIGMNIVVSAERNETGTLSDVYYTTPIRVVVRGEAGAGQGLLGKLRASFEKTFVREGRWKLFVEGAGTTLMITLASIIAGTLLGFGVYILCRRFGKVCDSVTDFFLWLIHGLPTVLLLMILYYIVFGASSLDGAWVSVVGFSLMFACSMVDMLRVGCNAIGKGQLEAAKAMGYSDAQSFARIILPQAAQHFLPIYRNEVVTLIKETSVVGYIAVLDLTKISDLVRSRTYEAFFPLVVTAAMYFVVSAVLVRAVAAVERKIDPTKRRRETILKGIREIE